MANARGRASGHHDTRANGTDVSDQAGNRSTDGGAKGSATKRPEGTTRCYRILEDDFSKQSRNNGSGYIRVGTLNVSTLNKRWTRTVALLEREDIDVAFLQECRVTGTRFRSLRNEATAFGYTMWSNHLDLGTRAGKSGGLVILSRIAADVLTASNKFKYNERLMLARIERPGGRPYRLAHVHIPNDDINHAVATTAATMCEVARLGGDR